MKSLRAASSSIVPKLFSCAAEVRERNVVTSVYFSRLLYTCTMRNRRPTMRAERKMRLIFCGWASVATSKSLGTLPSRRSRTAPPTT